jgi:hypothetical protein
LRFSPTTEESNFSATVYIKTDSQDNDEFYFLVKGAGYIKRPQITVKQGTATISPNGEYDYSSILVGTTKDVVFSIGNSGEANLNFISVNGSNANLENNASNFYSIIQQPLSATVAPGNTTTFTIRFNPTTVGNNYSATVKIITNSQSNDEFYFRVKGNSRSYTIGDRGPGGGIVFYAEGGQFKECSAELGSHSWNDAVTATSNYRGGGFTNWRLPDRTEIMFFRDNSRSSWGYSGWYTYYWTSVEVSSSTAWGLLYWGGDWYNEPKTSLSMVIAVRTFSL